MIKDQLLDDKKEIEAGLQNPDVPESAKAGMRQALKKIEEKLAELEKPAKPAASATKKPATVPPPVQKKSATPPSAKPAVKKGKPTAKRDEVFAALEKAHPDVTKSSITIMNKGSFEKLKLTMKETAAKAGAGNMAALWVGQYIKSIQKPIKKAAAPAKPKTKTSEAQSRTDKSVTRKPTTQPAFSWKEKVSEEIWEAATPVDFCGARVIEVQEDMEVNVKTTLKKGDFAMFNARGYFHAPLTPLAKKDFCKKAATTAIKGDAKATKENESLKKENGQLKSQIKALQSEIAALKAGAKKSAQSSAPSKSAAKPASAKPAPQKRKRADCGTDQYTLGQLTGLMIKFVKENTKKGIIGFDKEVSGLYYTRGEKAILMAKITDYGMLTKDEKWYRICPETFAKTKIDKPANGSYRRIVSEAKLKELYTTKEPQPKVYRSCLNVYRNFYECTKDGNCNTADYQKIKNAWGTCGNLHKKQKVIPSYMAKFHEEVQATRQKGEPYHKAMIWVSKEIKAAKKAA